jgi:hypothetical protein
MTLTTGPAGIVSATCSLQSLVAASPAKSELAEIVPQEKSPKGKHVSAAYINVLI